MPDISEPPPLRVTMEGSVATVTIDRREVLNALNEDVLEAIDATFARLDDDPAVRVAILRGAGERAFASGMDLKVLKGFDPPATQRHFDQLNQALRRIEQARIPIIAMIYGYAVGGGCELAAACDLRVAGSGARIGVPIGRFGHCPDRENLRRMLRLISPSHIRAMIMTDTLFDAAEALRMGFFNWVVPDAQLAAFTQSIALTVSQKSPLGLATFKRAMTEVLDGSIATADDPERDMITALWRTRDFQEGVDAFFERRLPHFEGR
jgi:enoyl-CoA hydratase/carnithine racemase